MFYVWYDDTPKKQTTDKLDEAISAYVARFAARPSHVLVNVVDLVARNDVTVQSAQTVQPNTFWLSAQQTAPVDTSGAD